MKIIDCFMYFDEDLILDIRLNTLSEIVDKFVVCEATRDHGGNKKNLNFKISKFQKFKDKINYIVVDDLPINVKSEKKIGMKTMLEINFKEMLYLVAWKNLNLQIG